MPCLVLNPALFVKQQREEGSASRTRRPRQDIAVAAGEHRCHQVPHRHALHKDTLFINVIFALHLFDERQSHLSIMVVFDICWGFG